MDNQKPGSLHTLRFLVIHGKVELKRIDEELKYLTSKRIKAVDERGETLVKS
jgi:hypothetical protein